LGKNPIYLGQFLDDVMSPYCIAKFGGGGHYNKCQRNWAHNPELRRLVGIGWHESLKTMAYLWLSCQLHEHP
jgi:hypothetical protein